MAEDILVRRVPSRVHSWIENERQQRRMTKQEFVLSVLEKASDAGRQLPLPIEPSSDKQSANAIPFTFVDLFAGIGGFRIPLEKLGGKCIFSSEKDRYSQKTYRAWFGETPQEDLTTVTPSEIPNHDVLAAGFPCQPFSIAGVSKKKSLGHPHGFKCLSQGTLFFNLATIIENKRPPIALLENVKNLRSHDEGRTWQVIMGTLADLEYKVFDHVIDAVHWVPQHRERIYIVCFDKHVFGDSVPFRFPDPPKANKPQLKDILEKAPDRKYTLTDHLWNYLQEYAARHQAKGNGFGFGLADVNGTTRTLSARYFKDGSEILIPQSRNRNPRRLTPRECARLMGFDEKYQENIVVSDTQAYRQFGNAIVPKVAEAVINEVMSILRWHLTRSNDGCLLKTKVVGA
jgi:DNA (cytosine-5)-methyltransferase 1